MGTTTPVARLEAAFDGRVITPGNATYDQARQVFNGAVDRRPAAIVRPKSADDVATAIRIAAETGVELAVRSGGHSSAGHGVCDGGIVLDLAELRGLEIDPEQRTAWAGAGLTAGEYTAAAGRYDLVTGFGDTGSVGLGGLTTGGGIGYLVRAHGLTVDNLLAAEVVTADGAVLHTDAERDPDLFWAIRGGGGNFGVVTRFQFRLHPLETVLGGMLLLPATTEVVHGFMSLAEQAPEQLSVIANIMPAPPMPFVPAEYHGQLVVMGLVCYAGGPEQGEPALAPFRALAEPIADLVKPIPYAEMFPPEDPDYRPVAAIHNLLHDQVDVPVAESILEHLAKVDGMRVAQLRVLGGAAARVPNDATAYAHRDRSIMTNVAAFVDRPDDWPVRQAWVDGLAATLRQGAPAAYANFLGDDAQSRAREAYPGPTWERLRRIKREYDPENRFRLNVNIPPAD